MSDRVQNIVVTTIGVAGSVTAWAGVLNLIATGLAIAVSACTLIIVAPKAWAQIKGRNRKS
jgi:hypothetical protein